MVLRTSELACFGGGEKRGLSQDLSIDPFSICINTVRTVIIGVLILIKVNGVYLDPSDMAWDLACGSRIGWKIDYVCALTAADEKEIKTE